MNQSARISLEFQAASIASLERPDDISTWLCNFKVRLKAAPQAERSDVQKLVGKLEARLWERRVEPA